MPWNETSAMDQRMHFIADYLEDYFPFSELCRRYGISRPTGYKWVQRYVDTGAAGLMAQSRRPVRCPHATSSDSRRGDSRGAPHTPDVGRQEAGLVKAVLVIKLEIAIHPMPDLGHRLVSLQYSIYPNS